MEVTKDFINYTIEDGSFVEKLLAKKLLEIIECDDIGDLIPIIEAMKE